MDLASGCFGEIMGEILACRKDEWEDDLRRMGFFLGKFIYLMDAYEDMERTKKTAITTYFYCAGRSFPMTKHSNRKPIRFCR